MFKFLKYLFNERGSFDVSNPSTTSSSSSYALSTYYVRVFLDRLEKHSFLHRFGEVTPLPKGEGKTVRWTRFTNFAIATADLTEGYTPTATWLTAANISGTVTQFGQYTPISDLLQMTGIDGILEETSKLLGYSCAQGVDWRIRNTLSSPAQAIIDGGEMMGTDAADLTVWWQGKQGGLCCLFYSPSGLNLTSVAIIHNEFSAGGKAPATDFPLTVWRIRKAIVSLRADAVPTFEDGFYKLITVPEAARQLMSDPEWQEMQQFTGRSQLEKGEVGDIAGVKVYVQEPGSYNTAGPMVTNTAPFTAGGAHRMSAVFNLIFGKGLYGVTGFDLKTTGERWKAQIIIKRPGPNSTNDPLNQVSAIAGYKVTFARAILDANRGYWFVTGY